MERFNESIRFHAWYEHWHRYHFISEIVKGKKVCDVACGVGYGSALLALSADHVTGVDIDIETIDSAKEKYKDINNLTYTQSNALNLEFADNSFDVVVSFETLEHLVQHNQLLDEFSRILKNDGLLVISTPDKDIYSANDDHNEFHVKELTSNEFDDLMSSQFKYNKTYGQQFQMLSVIEEKNELRANPSQQLYVQTGQEQTPVCNQSKPEYLIKVCSNNQKSIDAVCLPTWHSFADDNNSLFNHYDTQIQRLLHIDAHNKQLLNTIEKQNALINHLKARLGY